MKHIRRVAHFLINLELLGPHKLVHPASFDAMSEITMQFTQDSIFQLTTYDLSAIDYGNVMAIQYKRQWLDTFSVEKAESLGKIFP